MPSAAIAKMYKLACQYHAAGRVYEAETIYRQVLQTDPNHAGAMHHLGLLAHQAGRHDDAVKLLARALALDPAVSFYHRNLGEVLRAVGQYERAAEAYRRTLALAPDDAIAHHGLGLCFEKLERLEESIASYRRALELDPRSAPTHFNLGVAFEKLGKHQEAIEAFGDALEQRPSYPLARTSRATALLRLGQWERGWREYEARWELDGLASRRPDPDRPVWDGSKLKGKNILIRWEQGIGDTFLFSRFVPLVAERGGEVIFQVQEGLGALMRTLPGAPTVVEAGETLPEYAVQAPLLSLPRILGTTVETLPRKVPYLHADAGRVEAWRGRLGGTGDLKVGLVWSGSDHPTAKHRACRLEDLAPLAGAAGVVYYSLQKGEPAAQLASPPAGMRILDLGAQIRDWSDTASVISLLDLVISVDTAVPQLAGALGRPTWLLLPTLADFRWLVGRDDSPWYPSMRVFRQEQRGQWRPVVERVAENLTERIERLAALKHVGD